MAMQCNGGGEIDRKVRSDLGESRSGVLLSLLFKDDEDGWSRIGPSDVGP